MQPQRDFKVHLAIGGRNPANIALGARAPEAKYRAHDGGVLEGTVACRARLAHAEAGDGPRVPQTSRFEMRWSSYREGITINGAPCANRKRLFTRRVAIEGPPSEQWSAVRGSRVSGLCGSVSWGPPVP